MTEDRTYDVVVVGGGPAGLSGALALARARRRVLVVDAGEPRNAAADRVHNYLGREGTPPAELLALGRAEVEAYGAELVAGTVVGAEPVPDGFVVRLGDGSGVRSRRLLVTTGLVDELPEVPGVADRWGRDVLHCPYCHGWEVRDQALGVLATGPMAVHQALLFRQWSEAVTLLLHTAAAPSPEQAEQLAARGIPVVTGEVIGVEVVDDRLRGVRLADGRAVALDALVVAPRFTARSALLTALGLPAVDLVVEGHVIGSAVAADSSGATAVPGVWVAGNVTDVRAQVLTSAAAGLTAGAAINADLVEEDTRRAVQRARSAHDHDHSHGHGHADHTTADHTSAAFWDERYRSTPALWSGRVNRQLVEEAADLPPGRALELGSGEGADALWLAERGWSVTALDISDVALSRAAEQAARRGADISRRIVWRQADLLREEPDGGPYDLVSAQFLHLPAADLARLLGRLARCTASGGTLLVTGHSARDLDVPGLRDGHAEVMLTAGGLAALLDPEQWEVVLTETRPRDETRAGRTVLAHDEVLRARRR